MADKEEVRRSTSTDLNGMSPKDLPRAGANSGKRVTDDEGNVVPREHNKTEDDKAQERNTHKGH